MEFRTVVDIPHAAFELQPCERMICVGSCFADEMGARLTQEKFRAVVNPYGVMYNPASILHTLTRWQPPTGEEPATALLTLGTNHVYIERATGQIVDNCQKRPARLFEERELSIDECADYLDRCANALRGMNPSVRIIITVSPIRYRKYGYHGSQLSKATLLLAADRFVKHSAVEASYFPAYELMNDELRDYRFYREDMLHPTGQAVSFIWQRFVETYFSPSALDFLAAWRPVKEALAHRPFHPDSAEYKAFLSDTLAKARQLARRYPGLEV